MKCHLTTQWVLGHCEIPGNELADVIAKAASSLPEEHCNQTVSYGSSCDEIRECTKDPEIVHRRIREVYESLSMNRESQINPVLTSPCLPNLELVTSLDCGLIKIELIVSPIKSH